VISAERLFGLLAVLIDGLGITAAVNLGLLVFGERTRSRRAHLVGVTDRELARLDLVFDAILVDPAAAPSMRMRRPKPAILSSQKICSAFAVLPRIRLVLLAFNQGVPCSIPGRLTS
jgi:hypothetical protein